MMALIILYVHHNVKLKAGCPICCQLACEPDKCIRGTPKIWAAGLAYMFLERSWWHKITKIMWITPPWKLTNIHNIHWKLMVQNWHLPFKMVDIRYIFPGVSQYSFTSNHLRIDSIEKWWFLSRRWSNWATKKTTLTFHWILVVK